MKPSMEKEVIKIKTIILPGYSLHNKKWAYDVKENLEPEFTVVVYEWKHWKSPNLRLNIRSEASSIIDEIGNLDVNIIAKSVGTKVLMSVVPKLVGRIKKVILCGIPIDPLGYAEGLKLIVPENLLVIQNSKDPFMPYGAVNIYIKIMDKNIKVIKKESSTHDYPYYEDFKSFLR